MLRRGGGPCPDPPPTAVGPRGRDVHSLNLRGLSSRVCLGCVHSVPPRGVAVQFAGCGTVRRACDGVPPPPSWCAGQQLQRGSVNPARPLQFLHLLSLPRYRSWVGRPFTARACPVPWMLSEPCWPHRRIRTSVTRYGSWVCQHGPFSRHFPQDGATPLHTAAWLGRVAICKELLAHGADKDIVDLVRAQTLTPCLVMLHPLVPCSVGSRQRTQLGCLGTTTR